MPSRCRVVKYRGIGRASSVIGQGAAWPDKVSLMALMNLSTGTEREPMVRGSEAGPPAGIAEEVRAVAKSHLIRLRGLLGALALA